MRGVQSEYRQQFLGGTGFAERVHHADALHRHRHRFGHHFGHGAAQPADDVVLLCRHNRTGFGGRARNDLAVDRLDGCHIDHPRADAFGRQRFLRFQRRADHQPGGDDRHVGSVGQLHTFADFEFVIVPENRIDCQPPKAQVHRPVVRCRRAHGLLRLHIVRRVQDHHARDRPHQRDILAALVRRAVFADGDSCVRRADFDVQVRIPHRVANLLKRAPRSEHGKTAGEHHMAAAGQPRCHADHVAFGDAAIDEPFREFLFEYPGFGGCRQVGVQHDQVREIGRDRDQRVAVCFACCFFESFCHWKFLLTLRPAAGAVLPSTRPSPDDTAPRSGRCRASRPDFPCRTRLCPSPFS